MPVNDMKDKNRSKQSNDPKAIDPFAINTNASAHADSTAVDYADSADAHEPSDPSIQTHSAIENIIKDYRVIRTVSESSTSIVYKAEDIRTKRRVAIKVIYNRDLPDHDRISRARVEIERLRHLAHPGIASMLEAGTTNEGHCYIVSEFIKGVTLGEYLSIHKLSLNDRLSLFARLCEAVQYAHQRCLLHRDLRPSNILIDGKCNPKLVGFGVACVTDVDVGAGRENLAKRELREFLVYKSPEQIAGRLYDIDVRSDIYSLGVILYELLTDKLPYNSNSADNCSGIVQAVTTEMPQRPGGIKPSLRGDLEAIVLKALEKQPSDRYQTVLALSQDLECYFEGRPVGARRAGAMYEFRKLATRYKSRTISGIIMTLAVLAFGLHIHMTTRQAGHRRVAELEQQIGNQVAVERTAHELALRELDKAREALSKLQSETPIVQPANDEAKNALAELATVRSELTARAEKAEAEARTAQNVARYWTSVFGSKKSAASRWPGWTDLLSQGAARAEADFAEEPVARASILNALGGLMTAAGDAPAAIGLASEALELRAESLGEESEETIESMNTLASALFAAGKPVEAEPVCRRLVTAAAKTYGEYEPRTLTAMNNLALTLHPQKKYVEAEELLRKALSGRRTALGDRDRRTAATAQNLGMILVDQQQFERAEEALREAVSIFEATLPRSHVAVAEARGRWAACLASLGRQDEAEPVLLESLEALKTKLGADHPQTHQARQRVIDCYRAWGKSEKAEQFDNLKRD